MKTTRRGYDIRNGEPKIEINFLRMSRPGMGKFNLNRILFECLGRDIHSNVCHDNDGSI